LATLTPDALPHPRQFARPARAISALPFGAGKAYSVVVPARHAYFGNALVSLGEGEAGTALLEEAVKAYREALKEYTQERVPLDWAMSTGNQGVALMRLAERPGDASMAKAAVQQIEIAFTMMRDGGHAPFATRYKEQLLEARALLDRLEAKH
jgi:hypothetical protein